MKIVSHIDSGRDSAFYFSSGVCVYITNTGVLDFRGFQAQGGEDPTGNAGGERRWNGHQNQKQQPTS